MVQSLRKNGEHRTRHRRSTPESALGRCEHGKQAHCVGAVLVDSGLWIDTIIFRFDILVMPPLMPLSPVAVSTRLEGFAFGIPLNGTLHWRYSHCLRPPLSL